MVSRAFRTGIDGTRPLCDDDDRSAYELFRHWRRSALKDQTDHLTEIRVALLKCLGLAVGTRQARYVANVRNRCQRNAPRRQCRRSLVWHGDVPSWTNGTTCCDPKRSRAMLTREENWLERELRVPGSHSSPGSVQLRSTVSTSVSSTTSVPGR